MGRSVETLIMYACHHVFFNFFPRCPSTLKRVTDIDETRTSSLSFKWRIYVISCLYILNWNFYLLLIYPLFMHLLLKVSLVISFEQMHQRLLSFIISQVNPLTYDLRLRILGRKRKKSHAAFEPFARFV